MSVTGYKLKINGGALVDHIIDVGNVLTYDITGLDADTEYDVQVMAYNDIGNQSDYSDVVSATTDPTPPPAINVAASANGGAASSSTIFDANFSEDRANDGYRNSNNNHNTGLTPGGEWGSGGSPSVGSPEWLQITFSGPKTINEIDVFQLNDSANGTTDPTLTDTGTSFVLVDYKVQYWDGSAWVDIATVTGNNHLWNQFTFSPITTTEIRVLITAAAAAIALVVELEAWGS